MSSSKSAQDEHTTESSAGGEDSSSSLRLWHDASITHLSQLTPTVTGVTINVNLNCPMLTSDQGVTWQPVQPSKPFNFLPGQWVDFYIPPINKVGGYSITSLPSHLPRLELAVKRSRHPPAEWVTSNAKVGDAVKVRVGGEFVYSTAPDCSDKALLFIAGGVGINPLYGMLRQLHSDLRRGEQGTQGSKAILLYSASKADELLFEPELDAMAKEFSTNFRIVYHVTKDEEKVSKENSNPSSPYRRGRITSSEIGEALQWAISQDPTEPSNENEEGKSITSVYICGPTGFAEEMSERCKEHSVPRTAIHFEQWW